MVREGGGEKLKVTVDPAKYIRENERDPVLAFRSKSSELPTLSVVVAFEMTLSDRRRNVRSTRLLLLVATGAIGRNLPERVVAPAGDAARQAERVIPTITSAGCDVLLLDTGARPGRFIAAPA